MHKHILIFSQFFFKKHTNRNFEWNETYVLFAQKVSSLIRFCFFFFILFQFRCFRHHVEHFSHIKCVHERWWLTVNCKMVLPIARRTRKHIAFYLSVISFFILVAKCIFCHFIYFDVWKRVMASFIWESFIFLLLFKIKCRAYCQSN